MTSVILTRSDTVKFFVIHLREFLSTFRVCPYPILKTLFDKFLLCLCDCRFLFVENCLFPALIIFDIIKDTNIFQVQRFLNYLVGIDTTCAVCAICFDIGTVIGFTLDIPLARIGREVNFYIPLCISRCIKELKHKLLDYLLRQPSSTEPYGNLTCSQVYRLNLFQCFHIDFVIFRIHLGRFFCCDKFLPDITGEIFICHQILCLGYIPVPVKRI